MRQPYSPNAGGAVEIAYGVSENVRGRGYATEAAQVLLTHAFATGGEVRIARAHTMERANASARVLTKCGLRLVGQINDPEDGLVWRWEKQRQVQ
jgi:ribosomal-protein-alanine N-acetyltransferase